LFSDENSKKRFKQEAVIIDKLEHPHIIKIIERGESGRQLFTAMEYLEGKTLESKINENKQLSINECLHIMVQISDALVFIHGKNVIHRDLKPANIMLVQNNGSPDFVKLLDFGLARMEFQTRLTRSGNFIGTLEYMSPEQLLNADSSPANDIFSLGVIFYRMLSGVNPFQGETIIEIMREVIKKEPFELLVSRPGIPGKLDYLVMKMMDKRPEQRPSAEAIRDYLLHFIQGYHFNISK
jgi:serine/threonine-protein kinase